MSNFKAVVTRKQNALNLRIKLTFFTPWYPHVCSIWDYLPPPRYALISTHATVLRLIFLPHYRFFLLLLFSSDDFILNVTLKHSPSSSRLVTNVTIEFYFPPFIKFGELNVSDGFIKNDPDKNIFHVSMTRFSY